VISLSFSKIKDVWTKHWEQKKLQLNIDNKWMVDGLKGLSGALKNLGKPYFFQLATNSIRDVNAQCDKNEISYTKKAMI
jgi:hypothetical protein